jgi:hypothetical protein
MSIGEVNKALDIFAKKKQIVKSAEVMYCIFLSFVKLPLIYKGKAGT